MEKRVVPQMSQKTYKGFRWHLFQFHFSPRIFTKLLLDRSASFLKKNKWNSSWIPNILVLNKAAINCLVANIVQKLPTRFWWHGRSPSISINWSTSSLFRSARISITQIAPFLFLKILRDSYTILKNTTPNTKYHIGYYIK